MNWKFRPYQKKFIARLNSRLLMDLAVIGCAPTGSGKSKIMAGMAIEWVANDGKTVLIVTESTKIYDQLKEETTVIGINPDTNLEHLEAGHIYLAMCQTLIRRKRLVEQFVEMGLDLLVMNDESHIGTATNLLLHFRDEKLENTSYLIGFTATPDYRAAKHLPILYRSCVQACQVDDLIQDGFLCTYRHIARGKADLDILQIRGGDYSEESNERAFSTSEVYAGLFDDLRNFPFKKAMVFTASIKQAEETYMQLIENGFRACRYHSGNKDYPLPNPDYELAKFTKLNLCNVCVSVSSLTKGFDFPAIDMICILRKTKSLPLYLQMIGRASRPVKLEDLHKYPFLDEPKTRFIVLDYGSHWQTLGLYWDNRDWENSWQEPKQKKKKEEGGGVSTVKACENCDELIAVQCRVCPECGYEYPLITKDLAEGEIIEVTKGYTDLIGKLTSQLNPRELAIYAKIKNKATHAIRIAMHHEIERPGFVRDFGSEMGYKRDWIAANTSEALAKPIRSFADIELK